MSRLPLAGIKVVDLTAALSGPFCTQILADFGAEVIKIEPPEIGDFMRAYGPPYVNGESPYFMLSNRNKRSITLNLKSAEGIEALHRMVKEADVVVENYRPDVKYKLKIDYESLKRINPTIICASISGFGQSGPYAKKAGFDPIAQGMSGLMSVTGYPDGEPTKVGVAIGDNLGGMYTLIGILLALYERKESGQGQRVESSLLEALVSVLGMQASLYFTTGRQPERVGNMHPMTAPYGAFMTQNGYINIAAANQSMWERLCQGLDCEELISDERFLTVGDRVTNRHSLSEELELRLKKKTSQEWSGILDGVGVANGPILNLPDVFADPQVLHQEMLQEIEHPKCGLTKQIGIPVKMSRTPGSIRSAAPLLGQHTEEILAELGYGTEEIKQMKAQKVI